MIDFDVCNDLNQINFRYYETNNYWPATVVVFRDGVSDSQMDTVAAHEGNQFLNSLKNVDKDSSSETTASSSLRKKLLELLPSDYNPRFAYVVVQKRISTRIMVPRGPSFENPPPGTVLDHTVTRFRFKDFFLVPQAVTQGTVTPTHMVVSKILAIILHLNSDLFSSFFFSCCLGRTRERRSF